MVTVKIAPIKRGKNGKTGHRSGSLVAVGTSLRPVKEEDEEQEEGLDFQCETKPKRKMYDDEVDKFESYEEYLDSLVSPEDHQYLEDEEMARTIAELGYRSSGETLTREAFRKLKERFADARFLDNHGSTTVTDDNLTLSDDPLARALRVRFKAIQTGELHSVVFIRTKVYSSSKLYLKEMETEISGHIDLAVRQKSEPMRPYLTGEKKLVPRSNDLTYYNWKKKVSRFTPSAHFQVVVDVPKLYLRHRLTNTYIDISKEQSEPGSARRSSDKWEFVESGDPNTVIQICDIQIKK